MLIFLLTDGESFQVSMLQNFFFSGIDAPDNCAKVFVPGKPFKPGLTVESKVNSFLGRF
jgi:hypothetical protein